MVAQHEIDGACQLDGQHGVGLEFIAVHPCFETLRQWTEDGRIPFGNHGRFPKGPAQIRIAQLGSAQALDLSGTGDGAFDQPTVGEEIFDGGKAGDVAKLVEDGQPEVFADAGRGWEQGVVATSTFFGEFLELHFQRGDLRVVMADESQVLCVQGVVLGAAGNEGFAEFLEGDGVDGIKRDPIIGFQEGDEMDGGLFQAEGHAGLGVLLARFQQPFPERLRGGVNGLGPALAGGGGDEVQVGLFVGTIQADDEVIGMRGVHVVCFL